MREEILRRYTELHDIMMHHFEAALDHATPSALADIARRLGLADDRMRSAVGFGTSLLFADLGIYTAKDGRSRAIDRYARKVLPPAGSDAARVLEAMQGARFSIWRVERRHEIAGVVVSDLLRDGALWFPDPDFADEPDGITFAARLGEPEGFALACGITIPVDRDMFEAVAADPLALRHADPALIGSDPRFATAVYRAAIEFGVFDFMQAGDAGGPGKAERNRSEPGQPLSPVADAAD